MFEAVEIDCAKCGGSGRNDSYGIGLSTKCAACDGTGFQVVVVWQGPVTDEARRVASAHGHTLGRLGDEAPEGE
jgi:hypothetical protein